MRELENGIHRFTSVYVGDDPGNGGASHEYYISRKEDYLDLDPATPAGEFGHIQFQKGPVAAIGGVNGCFMEDLLSIVLDRLEGFQSGEYACRENALALTKVQEALHWLNHRTRDRVKRGVEGKFEK